MCFQKLCHPDKLNPEVCAHTHKPGPRFPYFKCLLPNIYYMFNSVIYLIICGGVPFDLGLSVMNHWCCFHYCNGKICKLTNKRVIE